VWPSLEPTKSSFRAARRRWSSPDAVGIVLALAGGRKKTGMVPKAGSMRRPHLPLSVRSEHWRASFAVFATSMFVMGQTMGATLG
jgi:hypothetical protein